MTTETLAPSHTAVRERTAVVYRMVMPEHTCPFGLKTVHLLRQKGFRVEDHWLKTREETDAFMAQQRVETTPQTFIDGRRIGGWDDLRRFFGKHVKAAGDTSYQPVVAVFVAALLLSSAALWALGDWSPLAALRWFVAFAMTLLAMLKLQDVESFSTMFLNYDLLARRWVPYAYLYPFGEFAAGVLMVSGGAPWLAAPLAIFIGAIGTASVFKAVYIDHRELKCACVGGSSQVPLGFVSMTENLMMLAMGLWTGARLLTG